MDLLDLVVGEDTHRVERIRKGSPSHRLWRTSGLSFTMRRPSPHTACLLGRAQTWPHGWPSASRPAWSRVISGESGWNLIARMSRYARSSGEPLKNPAP